MTGFEIYLLIYFVLNIGTALAILAYGGIEYGPGAAIIGIIWGSINVFLLLHFGV